MTGSVSVLMLRFRLLFIQNLHLKKEKGLVVQSLLFSVAEPTFFCQLRLLTFEALSFRLSAHYFFVKSLKSFIEDYKKFKLKKSARATEQKHKAPSMPK